MRCESLAIDLSHVIEHLKILIGLGSMRWHADLSQALPSGKRIHCWFCRGIESPNGASTHG